MYKCCFLPCFCASQRVQRRTNFSTNSGKATKRPIGTTFGTHMQIHMGMDILQTNCHLRHKGALGGCLEGQQFKHIEKPGKCGQTAEPIGDTFCPYNAGESGDGHRLNKLAP